jgi:hypothetical protein
MGAEGPTDRPPPPPPPDPEPDYSAVNAPIIDTGGSSDRLGRQGSQDQARKTPDGAAAGAPDYSAVNAPVVEAPRTAADLPDLRAELNDALAQEPTPGRIDLREGLTADLNGMNPDASYHETPSTEDRHFVQYFDNVRADGSDKWWTPMERAEQHVTLDRDYAFRQSLGLPEEASVADNLPPDTSPEARAAFDDPSTDVNEDLALPIDYAERDSYRVMTIPAGEQARYVESTTTPQHSDDDKRDLPGGGPQIRLLDYDPAWEVRSAPTGEYVRRGETLDATDLTEPDPERSWMDEASAVDLENFRAEAYKRLDDNLTIEQSSRLGGAIDDDAEAKADTAANEVERAQADIDEATDRINKLRYPG